MDWRHRAPRARALAPTVRAHNARARARTSYCRRAMGWADLWDVIVNAQSGGAPKRTEGPKRIHVLGSIKFEDFYVDIEANPNKVRYFFSL